MQKNKESNYSKHLYTESWAQIKTIVNTTHDSFLVLDKNFTVLEANETFYRIFRMVQEDVENKFVYELGNGEWNIPALLTLLQDIWVSGTFFKGFEVTREFPIIGRRVMILNARKIYLKEDLILNRPGNTILLVMEDITNMMSVADSVVVETNELKTKLTLQTQNSGKIVEELEKEIKELKKSPKKQL